MTQRKELEGGGFLELWEQGMMVRLDAFRPMEQSALYKVWIRGSGGEFLLGTLIPEGGQLKLSRTLSVDTLKKAGCWPVTGGKCAKYFHFTDTGNTKKAAHWHWDHHPNTRFTDPVLQESVASWGSMLLRPHNRGFQLAVPFNPRRPFPLTPLFCFAALQPVEGQPHLIFTFDDSGSPLQL